MHKGRIIAAVSAQAATREQLGLLMAGIKDKSESAGESDDADRALAAL
jgi:hypothetical protein